MSWRGTRLPCNPWQEGRSKKRGGNNPHITQHAHLTVHYTRGTSCLACLLAKLENGAISWDQKTPRFNKIYKTCRLSKWNISACQRLEHLWFLPLRDGTLNSVGKCNKKRERQNVSPRGLLITTIDWALQLCQELSSSTFCTELTKSSPQPHVVGTVIILVFPLWKLRQGKVRSPCHKVLQIGTAGTRVWPGYLSFYNFAIRAPYELPPSTS